MALQRTGDRWVTAARHQLVCHNIGHQEPFGVAVYVHDVLAVGVALGEAVGDPVKVSVVRGSRVIIPKRFFPKKHPRRGVVKNRKVSPCS